MKEKLHKRKLNRKLSLSKTSANNSQFLTGIKNIKKLKQKNFISHSFCNYYSTNPIIKMKKIFSTFSILKLHLIKKSCLQSLPSIKTQLNTKFEHKNLPLQLCTTPFSTNTFICWCVKIKMPLIM